MLGLFNGRENSIMNQKCGVDPAMPIDECRYVVIDTELTGLNFKKDSIVSVGAVAMKGSGIFLGETFYEMLSPETALRPESVVIHGITPSELADKPTIGEVIDDFLKFCEGTVVVGHFLKLDLNFLNRELKKATNMTIRNPVIDTLKVHEWIQSQQHSFGRHYQGRDEQLDLFTLARKYHIQVSEAHNALMDAFVTAQLFQRFLAIVPALGVRTVKDLLKIGRP